MNYLAQIDVPIDDMMIASNNLIVDQGIAIFAVVVFAIVIFGMMGLMFMMQRQTGAMLRQMGKESSQQDKLITQNDLNRVAAQRNTDELIDVKDLLARLIETQTQGNNDKHVAIQNGIDTINQLSSDQQQTSKQVTNMNGDIIEIKQAVQSLLQSVQSLSHANNTMIQAIETMSKNLLLILEKLEKETEEETEILPTPAIPVPISIPKELHSVPVTPKPEAKPKEASQ